MDIITHNLNRFTSTKLKELIATKHDIYQEFNLNNLQQKTPSKKLESVLS